MTEWDLQVDARGFSLKICEWNNSDLPLPTVILHGFLEQGPAWQDVARRLPGRVIAPDQRGFGLSDHAGAGGFYHFWDYVGDVDRLVDHLGGKVNLVGHSMGGTVACLFAGLRPQKVERLVLVEGLGPPDGQSGMLGRARRFLDERAEPPRHPRVIDIDDAVNRMTRWNPTLPPHAAHRLAGRVLRPIRPGEPLKGASDTQGDFTWTWDPLHRGRSPQPFIAAQFQVTLSQITAPVLYIQGGRSPFAMMPVEDRKAALANLREVVIPHAGHMLHHDAPAELAEQIASHLELAWTTP